MSKFNIWMEGFRTNGEYGHATYEGEYEAESFNDACDKWANEMPMRLHYYKSGDEHSRPSYWGCGLYDNEMDARSTFG